MEVRLLCADSSSQKPVGSGPHTAGGSGDDNEDYDHDRVMSQNLGWRLLLHQRFSALIVVMQRMGWLFRDFLASRRRLGGANSAGARSPHPSVFQQTVRSFLYVLEFAVAYLIMLVVMYLNGYFIISVLVGTFFGFFVFDWSLFNV